MRAGGGGFLTTQARAEDDDGVGVPGAGDAAVEQGVAGEGDELGEEHHHRDGTQRGDDQHEDLAEQRVLPGAVAEQQDPDDQGTDHSEQCGAENRGDEGGQAQALATHDDGPVDQQPDPGEGHGEDAEGDDTEDEQQGDLAVRVLPRGSGDEGDPQAEQRREEKQPVEGTAGFADDPPHGGDGEQGGEDAEGPGEGHARQPIRCAAARPASRPARFAPTVEAVDP